MDFDDELDQMLARSASHLPPDAISTAVLVAAESATPRRRKSVRRNRPAVLAGVACGTVLLVAAGTVSAYQLTVPPFVQTDPGTVRIEHGIPVNYTNSLGRRVDCLAFMDFANINSAQHDALEKATKSPEWTGYGDRVLAALGIPTASPNAQNDAISKVVDDDLWKSAHEAVPGLVRMKPSEGPVLAATMLSCAKPGGVDGKP